nr:hypothetical protein [Brevundimonas diminuta]
MFELFDSAFECGGDCLAVTFDNAINERRYLFLGLGKLTLEDRFAFSASRSLPLPHITEDSRG